MKKIFMLGMVLTVSLAMLLTSCKKEEINDNGNDNGNTENPGGGGSVTPNQEYPSTAVVLPQAVADIDGNTYDAVQIGDQVWMAQNLRTTRYADGTTISIGTNTSTTTAYRYAPGPNQSNEENMDNVAHYGYLYNWPAVMHGESTSEANPSGVQGICPNGWHVPSDAEWTQMIDYLGSQSEYVCGENTNYIAKALAATTGWNFLSGECYPGDQSMHANNAIGFSALPAGTYSLNSSGYGYNSFGYCVAFWCADGNADVPEAASSRNLYGDYAYVYSGRYNAKFLGFSVRCVKD